MQYVWDEDNHRYLDLASPVVSLGHRHPFVVSSMITQMHRIGATSDLVAVDPVGRGSPAIVGGAHPEVAALEVQLAATLPGKWRVLLRPSVADAKKLMRKIWRPYLTTMESLKCQEDLDRTISACRQLGKVVCFDETETALRTGHWWGFERYGVAPDVILCGDILASGMSSLGVVMTRLDVDAEYRSVLNPIAAVAASSVLSVMQQDDGLRKGWKQGVEWASAFESLRQAYPRLFGESVGVGTMHRIRLPDRRFGWNVPMQLMERGIRVAPVDRDNWLHVVSPVCTTVADIDMVRAELLGLAEAYVEE